MALKLAKVAKMASETEHSLSSGVQAEGEGW